MRTNVLTSIALIALCACATAPRSGPLGEGFNLHPAITSIDTAHPPRSAWIELDQQNYAVLLLVTPGRGVTVLFPRDSNANNRLGAGAHQLTFNIPVPRSVTDSLNRTRRRTPERTDTLRSVAERRASAPPVQLASTYLLLVASPQRLSYARVLEKTAGVSIPLEEMEALNAVAKAVKSTITAEPREWAAFYRTAAVTPER